MTVRSSTSLPAFVLAAVIVLVAPLAWQVILTAFGPDAGGSPSYLPALERTRVRRPFDTGVVPGLQRLDPGVRRSSATRWPGACDFDRLRDLTGERVAPILQNATGSAYWYLVFKNYVVASGIQPEVDRRVLSRHEPDRSDVPARRVRTAQTLDEVALDREDELNAVVAARTRGPVVSRCTALVERVVRR